MDQFEFLKNIRLLRDSLVAVDCETALIPLCYKGRPYIRTIQFASKHYSFYVDLFNSQESVWIAIEDYFSRASNRLIFHNASFDIRVLENAGIKIKGQIRDTMIMSNVLYNGKPFKHSLSECVRRELGVVMDKTLQKQNWMEIDLTPESFEYALNDVKYTLDLFHKLAPRINEHGLAITEEIERFTISPINQMEETGFCVDTEGLSNHSLLLEGLDKVLMEETLDLIHMGLIDKGHSGLPLNEDGSYNLDKKKGFNINSHLQLKEVLTVLETLPFKEEDNKPSVGKDLLIQFNEFDHIKKYLQWKNISKERQLIATLFKHINEDSGRIHARFVTAGTETGRISCRNPNLQQVKRGGMRKFFIAPKCRRLIDIDVTGYELAASAFIAQEEKMIKALNSGQDLHAVTAAFMFNKEKEQVTPIERQQAKATNFALIYGSSTKGLMKYFKGRGLDISFGQAKEFSDLWFKAYPAFKEWHKREKVKAELGEDIRMIDGRRRFIDRNKASFTRYCNNIVQGSCASAVKIAMFLIYKKLPEIDKSARLIAQIHDELIVEGAVTKAEEILELMKRCMNLANREIFGDTILFPTSGSIGKTWGDCK